MVQLRCRAPRIQRIQQGFHQGIEHPPFLGGEFCVINKYEYFGVSLQSTFQQSQRSSVGDWNHVPTDRCDYHWRCMGKPNQGLAGQAFTGGHQVDAIADAISVSGFRQLDCDFV